MNMNHELEKYIVFKISDCLMSLPMDNVLKVINTPPTASGWNAMGLIQIGNHTIRIVDLHQQLNADRDSPSLVSTVPDHQSFLVITRPLARELCGIIVDEPPNLVELSPDMIHQLPQSNRQLQMVSHAAIISDEEVTTTIFMLDLQQLLNPVG
ncbi:chemotaxis protein CheW [Coleofasciculus sp. G2-EDA-02]|uniref:chemotaxis protein CheW n=1 Tax=Coleofasciculus sp. G2-EDA-02 TaxID=3069529 RepID=UPI0032F8D6F9